MSTDRMDICAALHWYRAHLVAKRRISKKDLQCRIDWIEHFCGALPRRNLAIEEISVRDVVIYFANQAESFQKPLEWYSRYKAIESFWDDMVEARLLESNGLKGIYDDSDIEPYYQQEAQRMPVVPVNWSRVETVY